MKKPARLHVVARAVSIAATVLLMAGVSAPAQAQFAKPEDAVKYRQSAMTIAGNHMGRLNAQLKSSQPNMQVIQNSAALVETLSKIQFEGFVPGSEKTGNTRARAEAFTDPKVKGVIEQYQAEASKLAAVAKGGDVKAIQAQFSTVGKMCNSCHDDYRTK